MTGCTAETVAPGDDGPSVASIKMIDVKDGRSRSYGRLDLEIEHLIEIAVVEKTVPTDADGIPAHQSGYGSRVETLLEKIEVLLQFSTASKCRSKAPDRQIGQGQ